MRIVLLGSTGQIGSVIFKTLCEKFPNDEVVGVVRNNAPAISERSNHRYLQFLPFTNDWSVLGKTDVIINCIGIIKETKELSFEKAHIGLAKIIINNLEKIGNPKLIQVSILGADKSSDSEYSRTKAMADELLLGCSKTYIIRPSIVCTHNTLIVKKFRMLKTMSKIFIGYMLFPAKFFNTQLQPVMGDDVANVIVELCKANPSGRIIHLVGPEIIQVKELLKKYMGIKLIKIPSFLFDAIYNLLYPVFKNIIGRDQVKMLSVDNTGDKKAAEELLGRPMQSCDNFWRDELS